MGLATLSQTERAATSTTQTIYLVDWDIESLSLHLADRDFRYMYESSSINYESYIIGIDGLTEIINEDGNPNNSDVTIRLSNETYGTYGYLIQLNNDYQMLRSSVAIYQLNLTSDTEIFASDVRQCVGKYVVEEIYDITEDSFCIRLSSRLYDARKKWIGSRITRSLYPKADPNDIGKVRNTLYGNLEKVPARCIYTGAIDTLPSAVSSTASSIVVSGIAQLDFDATGTIQIDDEKITYTSWNSTTFTFSGLTRGASSTIATIHATGAAVFQVLSQYLYELAKHPIKSIDNVFVDDVKQVLYPSSGYTVRGYTGQPGFELIGYSSRAMLLFNVNPIVKKQINVQVTSERSIATLTGSHYHSNTAESSTVRACSSVASSTYTDNPSYAVDGSNTTAARVNCTYLTSQYGSIYISKNSNTSLGSLTRVDVSLRIRTSGISANTPFRISYGSASRLISSNYASATDVVFSFGSTSWTGNVGVYFSSVDFPQSNAWVEVYIASCTLYYTANPTQASPATGVETTVSGSTIVQGLSSADIVIGDEITADCQGCQDDSLGTYTGTVSALIERPDHIIKHFAVALMGFPVADIGTSFASSGVTYASLGFKFAFIGHDISEDGQQLLYELARNCRSRLNEWNGKLELRYLSSTPSTPTITLEEDDFLALPKFYYGASRDIVNKYTAFYRRDYRTKKALGNSEIYGVNSDAMAYGYMDALTSSYGAADMDGKLEFKAVRLSSMATNLLDFYLSEQQNPKLYCDAEIAWVGTNVPSGQAFSFIDRMYGLKVYDIIKYKVSPEAGRVLITGEAS